MPQFLRPAGVAAALLALLPLAAQAVQDCELNGQHVNPANGHTTAGKSGLMRCKNSSFRTAPSWAWCATTSAASW